MRDRLRPLAGCLLTRLRRQNTKKRDLGDSTETDFTVILPITSFLALIRLEGVSLSTSASHIHLTAQKVVLGAAEEAAGMGARLPPLLRDLQRNKCRTDGEKGQGQSHLQPAEHCLLRECAILWSSGVRIAKRDNVSTEEGLSAPGSLSA